MGAEYWEVVRDDMESGIVTSYKNKGIIIPELSSLPFFLRSSNICLKKLFFRQIFLKSIYFSSCKIPVNQESASLMVTNKVMSYTDYTMTPCIKKVFIATYICIWSTMYNHYANSHICCLWLEKDPIWFLRTKVNFASFLCTETHQSFVIRWWYHHSCCQWHKEDLSNSWIKDTRWKVMIILGYWTLHHFHTQTLQSLHLDWWYFLRCGNDFWGFTLIFGSKYDR